MKVVILIFLVFNSLIISVFAASDQKQFRKALAGYKYQFPKDHASHDPFKTEWWYYTGHLKSKQGKKFGFELTFFRSGNMTQEKDLASEWNLKNLYLAHFAMSNISDSKYFYDEIAGRNSSHMAGASQTQYKLWLKNWSIQNKNGAHILHAKSKQNVLDLCLKEIKKPVIHGVNGISQKASCLGCASHYYSITKLSVNGQLCFDGQEYDVDGIAWMDHEFGSNQLSKDQVGWDWFSIQLENNEELMFYVLRKKDGSIDLNSAGSYVNKDGIIKHLNLQEFNIENSKSNLWSSIKTKAIYPQSWIINIPSLNYKLFIDSSLPSQEFVSKKGTGLSYWEGACKVKAIKNKFEIRGDAYVEMTGYASNFNSQI